MGLFGRRERSAAAGSAVAPPQPGAQAPTVGVSGMGSIDPAVFGGPSTQALAADDPMLAPISGISLEDYARITKSAADQGVTDEAGVRAVAESMGFPGDAFAAAMAGWNDRMKQSMVVGQQFNRTYMAS